MLWSCHNQFWEIFSLVSLTDLELFILSICYCFIRLIQHSKLKTYTEISCKYLKAQIWKTNDLILFQNNLPNTPRTIPFHPNPPEWSFGWLLGNNIPASAHVYPLPYTGKDVFVPVSSCASSLTVLVCRHRTFCEGGVRLEKQIHFLGLFVYYLLLVCRRRRRPAKSFPYPVDSAPVECCPWQGHRTFVCVCKSKICWCVCVPGRMEWNPRQLQGPRPRKLNSQQKRSRSTWNFLLSAL